MEEDELAADDNPTKAYEVYRLPYASTIHDVMTLCPLLQLYCKRKAELILKQSQLAERGAPTMVLLVITAFKGELKYGSVAGGWCVSALLLPSSLQGRCVQLSTPHCGWALHY